jgi:hypothetical protein
MGICLDFLRQFFIAVVVGMIFGSLVEAAMISGGLYVATGDFNRLALRWILAAVVALIGLAIVFYPELFFARDAPYSSVTSYSSVFTQAILALHVWGSTAFGACAGYWLASSPDSVSGGALMELQ